MNDTFAPRPLTEETVSALLSRCCPQGQWDARAAVDARREVRYLLGQLALVHEKCGAHPVDESFCRRYDGVAWTAAPQAVMDLLSLGLRAGAITLRQEDHAVVFPAARGATLAPEDPAFPAWWEGKEAHWQPGTGRVRPQPPKTCGENLKGLLAAAEAGDAEAQYRCGAMFYQGQETEADSAAAFYWLEQAAEQGHPDAQCNCGMFCYNGIGTEPDLPQALLWFERAAEQGNRAAQFNCGLMYSEGQGTAKDLSRALRWFEKAAEQGHPDAQCNCGTFYFNGQGTERDREKAKFWFRKAAAQGDEFAKQVLAEQFQEEA